MPSVIAFDVSMGKSYMVIYNADRFCIFEGEILHKRFGFERLYDQMRALTRYYRELDEELALIRSRMHTLLQLTFPEMESLFTQKSELFLNILQLFPHPDYVRHLSKTVVRNRLLSNTDKKLAPKTAEKKALQLLGSRTRFLSDCRR